MTKYYCGKISGSKSIHIPNKLLDYCDIFLTHDTLAVRKAHNQGWKHAAAVKDYYSGKIRIYY